MVAPPVTPRAQSGLMWSVVAAAWILTLLFAVIGRSDLLMDHDALLEDRALAWPLAIFIFLATWQLMTIAMMLPSSLPMMRLFRTVSRRQTRSRLAYGLFLLGYFAIWTSFAVVALIGDSGLHWLVARWTWLADRPWLIGGTILMLAGAFQFSALKERCLDACRDPLSFLWRFYRRGLRGAWMLGIRHGLFCLGCCWALMLTMFAVGIGSITWMVGLTGVMAIEKTSRHGKRLSPLVGVTLLLWGALVLLHPGWLPEI
jgi:predicted metal-binding membrane protein